MKRIECPICGRVVETDAPHPPRPFCSARCKAIDLAAWLDGTYRLSRPLDPDEALELGARAGEPEPPS
ncbi:MAG: DNA gyrase inhibitor YacG [Polyangiaceae bacterium]|nr:DNA gyrase inhibitor YacG [Polyangiaceae bacterium]